MEETFTTEEELDSIESYESDDPFNNWGEESHKQHTQAEENDASFRESLNRKDLVLEEVEDFMLGNK